jgi:hypothetical protein
MLDSIPAFTMDLGAKPKLPSRPLSLAPDDGTVWASQLGTLAAGYDYGLFAPPPIFGAVQFGDFGGGGYSGGGSAAGGGESGAGGGDIVFYFPPSGDLGGDAGPGSDGNASGNGFIGGGGLFFGGAVPEPASWLLGLCAVGVLGAVGLARRYQGHS